MYHKDGMSRVPIHGAFSAIGTSFGALLPQLLPGRKIIAPGMQGQGRTADIVHAASQAGKAADRLAAFAPGDAKCSTLSAAVLA